MNLTSFQSVYEERKRNVMRHAVDEVFWSNILKMEPKLFAGFKQVFSDKTSTALKNKALVANIVHIVLLYFSYEVQ